jgi:hypothetical protein
MYIKKAFDRVILADNWNFWLLSFTTIVGLYRKYYEISNSHNDETGF